MAKGYVYIGGYQPHPEVLFIKVGMTTRPKERVIDYGGMVPGGLGFMRAARVDDQLRAERELLAAVASIQSVEPVGGEWFRCPPLLKLAVLDELHRIGSEVVQVHTHCPAPFGAVSRKRGKKRRG
jgi:hypothetical protein